MKLSIVVGTFNRKNQIQTCIESIISETTTPYCIYVTDAGSTDGTIEYLKSVACETIHPFMAGQKIGQARAYNDIFEKVTTPYACWLSDDNVIVNHGLDTAVGILEQRKRIGMVGLKVRDVKGPFVDAPYIGGISSIGILNVNQGVLGTDLFNQVGGFSECFRDYGIDPDLTTKVLFSGYDIVYTRAVAIHHYRNWRLDRSSPEYRTLALKQQRSLRLYDQKYAAWRNSVSPWLKLRRHLVETVKHTSDNPQLIHSTKPFMGKIPRDWFNILNGRFISIFDPFFCAGQEYYLRQRCPKHLLPNELPPDPEGAFEV
jgi:GT2 family glycosyltransferase